jgi:hypothetical protein
MFHSLNEAAALISCSDPNAPFHVPIQIHATFWSENLKGRDRLEDLCVDGRIILK